MSLGPIDRDSPIPAYYQIEMDLKERISRKEWALNEQIPSEAKLSEEYGVSRITLRQALAELEKDGIIRKMQGKGAFINDNPVPFVHNLNYAVASAARIGKKPYNISAKMLKLRLFPDPYPEVCENLEITNDTPVVYFERLFILDEKPIAIGRSWLPSSLVPNLHIEGLIDNQLSTTLKKRYQLSVERVEDYLEVVRPTHSECKLLETAYDCPLLLVKGISYLPGNIPLEYSNTLWAGDRVRFQIILHNTDSGFIINA